MVNENRTKIWDDYIAQGGMQHKVVKHMMVDYNRYHESTLIGDTLVDFKVDLADLKVLDYGCGVGDYGIHLLRQGAGKVDFYDYPRSVQLVSYRLQQEKLKNGTIIDADRDRKPNFLDYDLIIFGEVLEHLDNPFNILKNCNMAKVRFIFTSSYPYRSDDIDDPYWHNHDHDIKAFHQMPECRRLLEHNYAFTKFDGELRLWVRPDAK